MKLTAHQQKLPDTLTEGTIICLPHWMEGLLTHTQQVHSEFEFASFQLFFTGKNIGKQVTDQ